MRAEHQPQSQQRDQRRGSAFGLAAAALFGASAPLAKRLLPQIAPVMLAGLLYAGAGVALTIVGLIRARVSPAQAPREAALRPSDRPVLIGVVVTGGLLGPILMLWGLRQLSGISGALLLNLEAPLTALLAVVAFREHLGWRSAVAIAIIVAAASVLGGPPQAGATSWKGALAIAGACLAWAIDNNLTQRLSVRDPVAVVRIKTLVAGAINLTLAVALGLSLPPSSLLGAALLVGAASYGLSVVLDFHALRLLGAARESAFFATAPFVGALVAIPVLGVAPAPVELGAGVAMVAGVILLLGERHAHAHTHEPLEHDHAHEHGHEDDPHHAHDHQGLAGIDAPGGGPHAHPHRHERLTHEHPHSSDVHHRHRH